MCFCVALNYSPWTYWELQQLSASQDETQGACCCSYQIRLQFHHWCYYQQD